MPSGAEVERLVVRLIGDGSGYRSMMEQAATLSDRTSASIGKNAASVQGFAAKVTGYASSAVSAMSSMANKAGALATMGFGSVGAGAAAGLLGVGGIAGLASGAGFGMKLAAEAEQAAVSFEVMLGSAGAAKSMLKEIEQFAAKTPFEMPGLRSAAQMMLNFGVAQNKVMPTLKALGDVAAGDQNKLNGLAYAYSQTQAAGRLMGQDLLQMINWGFNPLQEMARTTGKSLAQLKGEMEAGRISAQMVEQAFLSASSKGGKFFGMMEKQSTTVNGLMSTLADTVKLETTKIGAMLIEKLNIKGLLQNLIAWSEKFGPMIVAGIGSGIDKMIQFGGFVMKVLEPVFSAFKSGFMYVWELGKWAFDSIIGFMENWGTNSKKLWKWLGENWHNMLKDMLTLFVTVSKNTLTNAMTLTRLMAELFAILVNKTVKHLFSFEFVDWVLTGLIKAGEKIRGWLSAIADEMMSVFTGKNLSGQLAKNIADAQKKIKMDVIKGNFGGKAKTMVDEMAEAVAKADFVNPLEGFVSSLTEMPEFKFGKDSLLPTWVNQLVTLGAGLIPQAAAVGQSVGNAYTTGMKSAIGPIEAVTAGSSKAYEVLANYQAKMAMPKAASPQVVAQEKGNELLGMAVGALGNLVEQGKVAAQNVVGLVNMGLKES